MRILLLNTQMEAAGAQKAMLTLAQGLKLSGHDVTVVTMYDKGNYVPVFCEQYQMDIINLQIKSPHARNLLQKGAAVLQGLYHLFRLMGREQFDIIQTFTHYSNIIGPLIAWLARVPTRVTSQRNSLVGYPIWLLMCDRFVTNSPLVQMMTAVSEGTRLFSIQQQGIRPDKLVTIYNGIDVAPYHRSLSPAEAQELRQDLGLEDTAVIILTVARLHPQKGHCYLIRAIPGIREAIPNVHFLFVGEGELVNELTAQIHKAGLENCVHLLGVRQDIPNLLAISHLFVLPSLWEGLPNAVLEAMAAGLPVVATNVDGCPELVVDGETGFLVPAADSQRLQQAIVNILQDHSLAATMAQAAKNRVINLFSIEQNISSYISLYKRLLP